MKLLFNDGNQHIRGDSAPDLRLHGVLAVADEVVGEGSEKVLTKNGSSFVAIVDARKLDYYHALEEEHAGLVLLDEAEAGLRQLVIAD